MDDYRFLEAYNALIYFWNSPRLTIDYDIDARNFFEEEGLLLPGFTYNTIPIGEPVEMVFDMKTLSNVASSYKIRVPLVFVNLNAETHPTFPYMKRALNLSLSRSEKGDVLTTDDLLRLIAWSRKYLPPLYIVENAWPQYITLTEDVPIKMIDRT